ncbi:MAG TPA: hypothetical protein PLB89_03230 [Flavobacteriales bacterium]|nr:hypothetical protein [Flavobacteriales bacterium]
MVIWKHWTLLPGLEPLQDQEKRFIHMVANVNLRSWPQFRVKAYCVWLYWWLSSLSGLSQNFTPIELNDPDLAHGSGFGHRVIIHDDYAFVSEPGDRSRVGDMAFPEGEVHVYRRNQGGINGWDHYQTLLPQDPAEVAFGWDMAMVGGRLIVLRPINRLNYFGLPIGAFRAIYVFELQGDTWVRTQLIEGVPNVFGETGGAYVSWIWAEFALESNVRLLAGDSTFAVLDAADYYRLNSGIAGIGTLETQGWWYRVGSTGAFERIAPLFPMSFPGQGTVAAWSDEGFVSEIAGSLWTMDPNAAQPSQEILQLIMTSTCLAKRGDLLFAGVGYQGEGLIQPPAVAVIRRSGSTYTDVELVIENPSMADAGFGRLLCAKNNGLLVADMSTIHWYDLEDPSGPRFSLFSSSISEISSIDVSTTGDLIVGSTNSASAIVYVRDVPDPIFELVSDPPRIWLDEGLLQISVPLHEIMPPIYEISDALGRKLAIGRIGSDGAATIPLPSISSGVHYCNFPGSSIQAVGFIR